MLLAMETQAVSASLQGVASVVDGDTIEIGLGVHHRAWNKGNIPAAFVEVQTGSYFGEDDIIRLEDDYDRTNNTTNQP